MGESNYVTRVLAHPDQVDALAWDALLQAQALPSPFMRHAYLAAMHHSNSACQRTGWTPHFITLEVHGVLVAGCVVYAKDHSYGEYVFDWAWANAYQQHGLSYYPKAVVAPPFTPVPGTRLMARDAATRAALLQSLLEWCQGSGMSSLHLLFAADEDISACQQAGLMLRHTVQFHWCNSTPAYADFESFLATLAQDKRKKIRQERRKVTAAGVEFRHAAGTDITCSDWDFFYHCYERTYLEHGNAPYLNRDFFQRMADTMPQSWVMFIAERNGKPVATSLIAVCDYSTGAGGQNDTRKVAYGRYWGALETIDCLHFEACYYQPLAWCIAQGYHRFEGGAQGEHKMARALLPVKTTSAHWLAHPAFADAVARFLEREGDGIQNYLGDLEQRSPFRKSSPQSPPDSEPA
jgi:predicted N-acyltransferase